MRNKITITALLSILFISHHNAQSADSILTKYFQAAGSSKLAAVNTIIFTGKITGGNLRNNSVDYLLKKVRPFKKSAQRNQDHFTDKKDAKRNKEHFTDEKSA